MPHRDILSYDNGSHDLQNCEIPKPSRPEHRNSDSCCCCPPKVFQLFERLATWDAWKAMLMGQFLAMMLCGTGVTSQYLSTDFNVNMPTAQSFINYALLCLIFTSALACRPTEKNLFTILKSRGWKYVLIGAADVEANYLIVRAYQYTTLTSIQLLDCFTIPVVLTLSFIFLKVRYKIVHILGVGICLLGVGCLVWADVEEGRSTGPVSNKLLGDMLCLSGAVLYGISNVCEEYAVKSYDHIEFLGMLGLFGSVINGIQLAVFERKQIAMIKWDNWYLVLCLIGYGICLFLLYVCMPLTMKVSSATAVNLSVLTADFYSLLFGIYLFKYKFHPLYFLSFTLIIVGVIIFFLKATTPVNLQVSAQYRQVPTVPESASKSDVQLLSGPDGPGTSRSNTYNSLQDQTLIQINIDSSANLANSTVDAKQNLNSSPDLEPGGYKRNGMITIEQSDWTKL